MDLTKLLYNFYDNHGRDLPWRHTTDPYAILVSEVMLQQTQVSRVIDKYKAWMTRFPTIESLAAASFTEVLRYWIGLGYNRRAKYLYDLSQEVVNTFSGHMPDNRQLLLKLPGMGPYTSAAVCVFAYNQPIPLIETNVRTVFIHYFFHDTSNINDRDIMPLVEQSMDRENPRKWFNAIMDYGTYLKETEGNASTRSKSYSKQSKFSGSVRQVRGTIVKMVTENSNGYSNDDLVHETGYDIERIKKATEGLVRDGIVREVNGKFKI